MKKFKKMLALVIAFAMVLGMSASVWADSTTQHTITINNPDQYVTHTYEAYQIFKGDLSEDGSTLTNIAWGNGVNSTALLTALKGSADLKGDDPLTETVETNAAIFGSCDVTKPGDVAKVLGTLKNNASAIDAVAKLIAANKATKAADFTADASGKTYTAEVTGDGYYIVIDTTTNLNYVDQNTGEGGSDTLSAYILQVVNDVNVNAKDTGMPVDKNITGIGPTKLKENSSDIGDVIDFEVTSAVPDTSKFEEFYFAMTDKLCDGLTFYDTVVVKIGNTTLTEGTDYTLSAKNGETDFTVPATVAAAVETAGGQKVTINFTDIKQYGDDEDYQGETITITYKAVLNKNAEIGTTENPNEVCFEYSKNPEDLEERGTTPKITTKTYTTKLEVLKVDGNNEALEGAVFELAGSTMNFVVVTGEKYEEDGYVARNTDETVDNTTAYYKLAGGAFTTTPYSADTADKYDSDKIYRKVTMNGVVETSEGGTEAIEVVSGSDGKMSFTGLKPGSYTLTETAAPDGFNKITDPIKVNIKWTKEKGWEIDANSDANLQYANGVFTITIENESGAVLPSTGGIGTTIFYALGTILVLGAGVVLVTRRRMSAQ